jgi:hypothetical protein
MTGTNTITTEPTAPDATPETTLLLLATFADLYRQEVSAEEDVHRTLPFFGTALGIVIGALAYAAGRLPKWPDVMATQGLSPLSQPAFCSAWRFSRRDVFSSGFRSPLPDVVTKE